MRARYSVARLAAAFVISLSAAALCASSDEDGVMRIGIDDCVKRALDVNIAVLRAKYDVDRADGAGVSALSYMLPRVSYSVFYLESVNPRVVDDRVVPPGSFGTALRLTQPIFYGGSNVARYLKTGASKRASEEGLLTIESEVAFTARQRFLDVLRAKKLLEVQEEALELSEKQLERARALVEVGSAVISDVLRARVEVSRNELELISARNGLRLAETALCHFLAIDGDCRLELDEDIGPVELKLGLDEAIEMAVGMRPEVREAEAVLRSRNYAIWEYRGDWLPSLAFSADYSWAGSNRLKLGEAWEESEWQWRVDMRWDLFNGLSRWGDAKQARANVNTAEEDLAQTKRDVALEVKEAYYNVEEAEQRVKVSAETVDLAEEELKLAGERYRLGAATMLEQIDSQVSLSTARTSYVEARYDYVISLARLARAIGMR